VDAKDGRLVVPSCEPTCSAGRADPRSAVPRGLELRQFRRDLPILETLRIGIDEDLVDAVGGPDRDARRYGNASEHVGQCNSPAER